MNFLLKRIFLIVFLLCVIFSLSGCYYEDDAESDTFNSEIASLNDDTQKDKKQTNDKKDSNSTEKSKQTEEALSGVNLLRKDYNFGTCKTLSGNISVILFYVDDFESKWTNEEIDLFTKNEVEPGLVFLEQEAKKYGVELNLTVQKSYSEIYYDDEVITSVANTGFASADVLWQAALQINYPSSQKMIQTFRNKYKTEEVICLTVFNKSGTAYAFNPTRDSNLNIDEHCIVFARDLNSTKNGPAGSQASVVAHEMLHLFGAEDYYASTSRKSLAKEHYPDDIMLSAAYDIKTNTIEDVTAFYVGWTNEPPKILYREGW